MPSPATKLTEPNANDTIDTVVAAINLAPRALVLVLADFDPALAPAVKALCSRSIVPAAVTAGAAIVDNGVDSGCAALIGQAARDSEESPALIGIAAHDKQDLEPNHTPIIRLPREWPDPIKAELQIVGGIAKKGIMGPRPVLAVLFGGGALERTTLVGCARRGWPVLVVKDSGGLADEIVKGMDPGPDGAPPCPVPDPDLREVIETADIYTFPISGNVDDLSRILLGRIDLRLDTLIDSWKRYDELDHAAIKKQALFTTLQWVILTLGVVATALAIMQSGSAMPGWLRPVFPSFLLSYSAAFQKTIHVLMVLTPITISVLVAASSRFREGNKWILLRASAEAVKREIFRYRMQAGAYSNEQCVQTSRESKLAVKLKDISSALVQSEVNRTSLPAAVVDDQTRLSFLIPEHYLRDRIDDQINYFVKKTQRLYKRLRTMQIWVYAVGGAGTFLAAFRGDVWVALTTAIAAALTTRLEMDQVENTLVQYNQALTGLRNIVSWWRALTQWEKGRRKNIDLLVEQTEKTLEGELAGWVQQMQTALDKLTEKEQAAETKDKAATAAA